METVIKFVCSILLVLGIAGIGMSCFGSGSVESGQRMVLTSKDNVTPEALAIPGEVVELKAEDLRGDVGQGLKDLFESRGSTPVITVESNLKPLPTDPTVQKPILVILDRQTTEELFSSDFVQILLSTIGVNLPGPWQPYAIALGGILGLFNKRFRSHATTAAKRTVPGIQGPNNDGRIPNLNDIGEGIVDAVKAITFRPIPPNAEKPLNG
jgi:hypothetical protein